MTSTLTFDITPHTVAPSGATGTMNVKFGPKGGSLTDYGNHTTDPSVIVPPGVRPFKTITLDVTAVDNPSVEMVAELRYISGVSAVGVRKLRLIRNGVTLNYEYPQYCPHDADQMGDDDIRFSLGGVQAQVRKCGDGSDTGAPRFGYWSLVINCPCIEIGAASPVGFSSVVVGPYRLPHYAPRRARGRR